MLADDADVVIGVDTHRDIHTASAISSPAGIVLEQFTCSTDAAGLAELVAFADQHPGRRAWAVEGTGSYSVGLHRMLTERGERIVETERPHRPGRRGGKSDSIDATKGAREALAAEHPAQPRERGDRAALATLLAARRSAVDAAAIGRRQLHAFVLTAPQPIRDRFQTAGRRKTVSVAERLRNHPSHNPETTAAITALRSVAPTHPSARC